MLTLHIVDDAHKLHSTSFVPHFCRLKVTIKFPLCTRMPVCAWGFCVLIVNREKTRGSFESPHKTHSRHDHWMLFIIGAYVTTDYIASYNSCNRCCLLPKNAIPNWYVWVMGQKWIVTINTGMRIFKVWIMAAAMQRLALVAFLCYYRWLMFSIYLIASTRIRPLKRLQTQIINTDCSVSTASIG